MTAELKATYPVNENISEHFMLTDLSCPCCDMLMVIPAIFRHMALLEKLYALIPLEITSGYRCKKHNREVGGSVRSWHLKFATDILALDKSLRNKKGAEALAEAAEKVGFNGGIGIYTGGNIHLDLRPELVKWRG